MDAAIGAIDHEIVAIPMFVGKAAVDRPPDERLAQLCGDSLLDAGAIEPAGRKFALHQADDIAALAHAPQRILQPPGEPVAAATNIFG